MVWTRRFGIAISSIVILALLLSGVVLSPSVLAGRAAQPPFPEGESEFFSSTGHYVRGPFLTFYRTRGGSRIFGYPQTEVFYDTSTGLWVQFFDNVRMEWHPENPPLYQVQLGLLGEILGHRTPPIPTDQIPRGNPFRRYFPEMGHVVSFAFLIFYDQNGGLDIFGYPISEPLVENGRIVQYFQRARMEWHPERPRDERVMLGALGLSYMQRFPVPAEYRRAQPPPSRIAQPAATTAAASTAALRVSAFVRDVVVGRQGNQTVYVYVTDEARQQVSGASVSVTVLFPSGAVQYTLPQTDSRGITSVVFDVPPIPPGQRVVVSVTVRSGEQEQTAETFFVSWY